MKLRLVIAAISAAAAISAPVAAQQAWLSDRRYQEGIGIRAGDLEFHPSVAGEFGYDSNYFQRADNENPQAAYRLRITPAFSLSTLGPQRRESAGGRALPPVMFDAAAFASYNELFAADSAYSNDFSKQRHLDVGASLSLKIARTAPLSPELNADYLRVGEPSNSPDEQFSFNRGTLRVGPGLLWRPGGGLFEWRVGYELIYNYFEAANFKQLDNLHHTIATRGRWKFLPRTALLYDGSYTFIRYLGDNGPYSAPSNGDILRARVGLTGLITPRIGVLGLVGWTSSFYEGNVRNADTIIGQAEIKYYAIPPPSIESTSVATGLSTISLGYAREVANSYINAFYQKDRGYLRANYFLAGFLYLMLEGGFSHYYFPPTTDIGDFTQNRIDARLFAEYRFSSSFGLNTTIQYDQNMSDPVPGLTVPVDDNLDFARWRAFIGVRWFM